MTNLTSRPPMPDRAAGGGCRPALRVRHNDGRNANVEAVRFGIEGARTESKATPDCPRRSRPLCCQGVSGVFFGVGFGAVRLCGAAGRRVVPGSGVACRKSRFPGGEPGGLESEAFPPIGRDHVLTT